MSLTLTTTGIWGKVKKGKIIIYQDEGHAYAVPMRSLTVAHLILRLREFHDKVYGLLSGPSCPVLCWDFTRGPLSPRGAPLTLSLRSGCAPLPSHQGSYSPKPCLALSTPLCFYFLYSAHHHLRYSLFKYRIDWLSALSRTWVPRGQELLCLFFTTLISVTWNSDLNTEAVC